MNSKRNPALSGILIMAFATIALADDDILRDMGTNAAPGEIPKWDGSKWRNAHDDITTVSAGPGLTMSGTGKQVNIGVDLGGSGTNTAVARFADMDTTRPPLGAVVAWLKSFPNVPTNLPAGWVECKGQTLTDSQSPLNGQQIPDLNGVSGNTRRFLRGAQTSGGQGGSDTHSHSVAPPGTHPWNNSGTQSDGWSGGSVVSGVGSSLPTYYEVVWIMRVK